MSSTHKVDPYSVTRVYRISREIQAELSGVRSGSYLPTVVGLVKLAGTKGYVVQLQTILERDKAWLVVSVARRDGAKIQ